MQLRDKVFLITGASSGLGAATARRLAAGGARVALLDVNAVGAQAIAAEIGAAAFFFQADVCDERQIAGALRMGPK